MKNIAIKIQSVPVFALAFCLCLFSLNARALETRFTIGVHDFIVSGITPSSLHEGGTSHTFGVNGGVLIEHTTPSGIVLGGIAEFYEDDDRDHLDPDHFSLWYKFNAYGYGPILDISPKLDLLWHIDLRNKLNTVSGVEREIKNFYGVGLDFDNQRLQLALNGYTGFFYLEIDDDAPRQYAGYDREDLGNGTTAVSLMLDGSYRFSQSVMLEGYLQNWTSIGVGSDWLENELMLELNFNIHGLAEGSRLHFRVTHTRYNLDFYYRADLGKPVLPWDNDTVLRAYLSVPWEI